MTTGVAVTDYERGMEAGRLENRVHQVERDQSESARLHVELAKLVSETVTTVQLLAKDIETRGEAAIAMAAALKEERDNAAEVLRKEKEQTATNLANASDKANIRFAPRMFWIAVVSVLVVSVIGGVTFYATYHK